MLYSLAVFSSDLWGELQREDYICLPPKMSLCCGGGIPSFSSTLSLILSIWSVTKHEKSVPYQRDRYQSRFPCRLKSLLWWALCVLLPRQNSDLCQGEIFKKGSFKEDLHPKTQRLWEHRDPSVLEWISRSSFETSRCAKSELIQLLACDNDRCDKLIDD